MKHIYTFILTLITFIGLGQADSLPNKGNTVLLMKPEGYTQLNLATGFLNDDNIQDFAIVVQSNNEANIKIDAISKDTINLNPRILAIYFGDDKGYFNKQLQVNDFILIKTYKHYKDPLVHFSISNTGLLEINYTLYTYKDSWITSKHNYTFNYKDKNFNLVKYITSSYHRPTFTDTKYTFYFQKRKKVTVTTTLDKNSKEQIKKESTRFKLKQLRTLKELKTPFQWDFMGIHI